MGFTLTVSCRKCDEKFVLLPEDVTWGNFTVASFVFMWNCPGCGRTYYEE